MYYEYHRCDCLEERGKECSESSVLTSRDGTRAVTVTVVVLNYDGERFIETCLRSLKEQTFPEFEIIVVDNASNDNSLEVVRRICSCEGRKKFKIIVNSKNLGYCGGNNVGIRESQSEYIVLLNSDTCVAPSWLENLVKAAKADKHIGICQSKLLYEDGHINSTGNLCDIYGYAWGRGRLERDSQRYDLDPFGFFYASGASLLIKRACISKVGLLDEVLFAYHDDVDLSWRARLMGLGILYVPSSVCFHKESRILPTRNPARFFLTNRNRIRVLLKNYSTRKLLPRIPAAIVLILLAGTFRSIVARTPVFFQQAIRSLLWNLQILPDTLQQRSRIQRARKTGDGEIEKYMVPYSLEICQLGCILRRMLST